MSQDASRGRAPVERLAAGTRTVHADDGQLAVIEMRDAAQWLARAAHSYGASPDSRLQLRFDDEARLISTFDLAPATRLGLQLPGLVFQFYEQGIATPHALDVDDRSSTEIEAWLLAELLHRGFDRSLFKKKLPYAWVDQMSGDEAKYASHRLIGRLDRLTQKIVEAAVDLKDARQIAGDGARATASSDLLFWPDRCVIGFALSRDGANVEIGYEAGDGDDAGRFRVTKDGVEESEIAKAPDGTSVARDIARAIESSQENPF